jgi:hypothetical protein
MSNSAIVVVLAGIAPAVSVSAPNNKVGLSRLSNHLTDRLGISRHGFNFAVLARLRRRAAPPVGWWLSAGFTPLLLLAVIASPTMPSRVDSARRAGWSHLLVHHRVPFGAKPRSVPHGEKAVETRRNPAGSAESPNNWRWPPSSNSVADVAIRPGGGLIRQNDAD